MQKCSKCGKSAYVFRDGVCYDCMDEVDKKLVDNQYNALKAQFGGNSGNENVNAEVERLKNELESEKTLKEDYESKLRLIAEQTLERKKKELGAPLWITKPEELAKWAESEGIGEKAGAGVVSLRGEDVEREKGHGNGKMGFDSEQEMIDYLRSEAQKGNAEAQEQLNKLWEKCVRGLREAPQKTLGFEYKDKDWLKKFREKQTEDWKKKVIGEKHD